MHWRKGQRADTQKVGDMKRESLRLHKMVRKPGSSPASPLDHSLDLPRLSFPDCEMKVKWVQGSAAAPAVSQHHTSDVHREGIHEYLQGTAKPGQEGTMPTEKAEKMPKWQRKSFLLDAEHPSTPSVHSGPFHPPNAGALATSTSKSLHIHRQEGHHPPSVRRCAIFKMLFKAT